MFDCQLDELEHTSFSKVFIYQTDNIKVVDY